jgi:hypothetical protein
MSDVARDALARIVASRLLDLSHDEVRVLDRITTRMMIGHHQYGRLDLKLETRDWRSEAEAELVDYLFYGACREISANDARLERLRCEAADELHVAPDRRLRDALIELRDSQPVIAPLVSFEMEDA